MKALSIQQPWAWAIVKRDKRVENRTWPTTYRGRLGLFDLDEQALAPETAAQLWMWFEWFV